MVEEEHVTNSVTTSSSTSSLDVDVPVLLLLLLLLVEHDELPVYQRGSVADHADRSSKYLDMEVPLSPFTRPVTSA